jgi:hypothetical protein
LRRGYEERRALTLFFKRTRRTVEMPVPTLFLTPFQIWRFYAGIPSPVYTRAALERQSYFVEALNGEGMNALTLTLREARGR